MKVKRLKRAHRLLNFYKYNYKFIPPYNVLIDGTFSNSALQEKLNLAEQIPKYLADQTNLFTTKCVLAELEQFGPLLYGARSIAKQFEIAPCNHQQPRPASECISYLARRAGNGKTKYIIATQDRDLKEKIRKIVGTPILFIKSKNILLDNISDATKANSNPSQADIERLQELKDKLLVKEEIKKKKKKKGVNPLSCKKKVMKVVEVPKRTGERTSTGKRKRTKKKHPQTDEIV